MTMTLKVQMLFSCVIDTANMILFNMTNVDLSIPIRNRDRRIHQDSGQYKVAEDNQ